jgi:hypothetical protein
MISLSKYNQFMMMVRFFQNMETDQWIGLEDIMLNQPIGGGSVPLSSVEMIELVEVGKAVIETGLLDPQEMELSFNNNYTRVKKSPWKFNLGDNLYVKKRDKFKKNGSIQTGKLEKNSPRTGDILSQEPNHSPAEAEGGDNSQAAEESPGD